MEQAVLLPACPGHELFPYSWRAGRPGQLRPNPDVSPMHRPSLSIVPVPTCRLLQVHQPRLTSCVCELFADVRNQPVVRIHGDAHVEQFALTRTLGPG
jgi:hypothetical protein